MSPVKPTSSVKSAALTLNGIAPGATGQFAVDFLDKDGNVVAAPPNIVPQWVSSDPKAVVTPSTDGLTASVAVDASVDPKATASFDLTVGATLADNSAIQGTATVPYLGGVTTANPVSLGIRQTA